MSIGKKVCCLTKSSAMKKWGPASALFLLALALCMSAQGESLPPAPINGLHNGNFEYDVVGDPFGFPWKPVNGAFSALEHVGLSATGLAPDTKGAYVAESIYGSLGQSIDAAASDWELSFLFAAEKPETGRTLHFTVNHTSDPNTNMILMRIVPNGNLEAYKPGSSWTALPGCEGIIDFSVDANADGSLDDAGDTLNVYSIKIVGDYTGSPKYDVYLSQPNSGSMTLMGNDLDWFIGTPPLAGDKVSSVAFCQYQTVEQGASYLLDEVYFQSGLVPEPGCVAMLLSLVVGGLCFTSGRKS